VGSPVQKGVFVATVDNPQDTLFTFDVLGRYGCNTLQEAVNSIARPNPRMFDFIIIGGGSFGAVLASHLLNRDRTQAHRILVLEAGPFAFPEDVQNLPGSFAPRGKNNPGTFDRRTNSNKQLTFSAIKHRPVIRFSVRQVRTNSDKFWPV
jgi:hypothetical protein